MHALGEGVTRNFLSILETESHRTARSLARLALAALLVTAVAVLILRDDPTLAYVAVPALFVAAFLLGAAYTKAFTLDAYEVSLRDHWNRWMRWSVSCRTVRECYHKVHDHNPTPRTWTHALGLTLLILIHLFLATLVANGAARAEHVLPILGFDAILAGFAAGRRLIQRRWYKRFLNACNDLLRNGDIGLWGVF